MNDIPFRGIFANIHRIFVHIISSQKLTQITHETLKNDIKFRMIISVVVIFYPFWLKISIGMLLNSFYFWTLSTFFCFCATKA